MTAASLILEAFQAESGRLSAIAAGTDDAAFARPSPCAPWTVAELFFHVRMTMARLSDMLGEPEPEPEAGARTGPGPGPGPEDEDEDEAGARTEPEPEAGARTGPEPEPGTAPEDEAEPKPGPASSGLVTAPGYYRADQRFSPAVNEDRIRSARRGAAAFPAAADRARDFRQVSEHAVSLLHAALPRRVVRTRHGDRMLLSEFTRTRVLELAVHGLDLAAGLAREPWMTAQAAQVTAELLLPGSSAVSAAVKIAAQTPASAAVKIAAQTPASAAVEIAAETPASAADPAISSAASAAIELREAAGWDLVTLIAKLTGRAPVTPAEDKLVGALGVQRLALG